MRNVRNFWAQVYIDGRKPMSGGPKCKEGGMMIEIFQRNNGTVKKACTVYCTSNGAGVLTTEVEDHTIPGEPVTPILRTVR